MIVFLTLMLVINRFTDVRMNKRAFEIVDDRRAGKVVVNLTGRLNECGVISPRFDVQLPVLGLER